LALPACAWTYDHKPNGKRKTMTSLTVIRFSRVKSFLSSAVEFFPLSENHLKLTENRKPFIK
jgi:hypothetical protein